MPFLREAQQSRLGALYLRLSSGNVGSRILPVRIHNLNLVDEQLLEKTMGRQLRTIDFVYQELGVNRPLRPEDEEYSHGNGGLLYRNQLYKVANAIKELIAAVRPATGFGAAAGVVASPTPAPAQTPLSTPTASVAPAVSASVATGPVVFLAWSSKELIARREELALVRAKAGLRVVSASSGYSPTSPCMRQSWPARGAHYRLPA